MHDELSELDRFWTEVLVNLADQDITLDITDSNGECPVVVALDEERLAVLMRRVEGVGGFANVFSRGKRLVRQVSVLRASDALFEAEAENMTAEPPSGDVSVGAFLDYVETQKRGVVIPALPNAPTNAQVLREVREVAFA